MNAATTIFQHATVAVQMITGRATFEPLAPDQNRDWLYAAVTANVAFGSDPEGEYRLFLEFIAQARAAEPATPADPPQHQETSR